jgi:hypothetical protein
MSRIPNFTEGLKHVFLDTLRATCNITLAAQAAGVSSSTCYHHKKIDPLFSERWDEALNEGVDLLEAAAHKRAFEGVDDPVFFKGEEVGSVRKYSDALTMFLLKAHRPDKYRERSQIDQNMTGAMQLQVVTGVPEASSGVEDLV